MAKTRYFCVCCALLAGCESPFQFLDSFAPTTFLAHTSSSGFEDPFSGAINLEPDMPIEQAQKLLEDGGYICVRREDEKKGHYLECVRTVARGQDSEVVVIARVYHCDGKVTQADIRFGPVFVSDTFHLKKN